MPLTMKMTRRLAPAVVVTTILTVAPTHAAAPAAKGVYEAYMRGKGIHSANIEVTGGEVDANPNVNPADARQNSNSNANTNSGLNTNTGARTNSRANSRAPRAVD